jgi:ATP-binding cassette, subfamily C (CFTR/MRP), member 4
MEIKGKVSYAAQKPWLFEGSIKKNILFFENFEKERYEKVIYICDLEKDLKLFQHGDETLVGDRGVKLSGGQKARINLARALYKEADIYLLDDILSSVDAHVGKHIFENCFKVFLKVSF